MGRRSWVLWIAIAISPVLACASVFGIGPRKSREDAIAACVESVPAETVPYGDAFAACMERYGWVHQSVSAPAD